MFGVLPTYSKHTHVVGGSKSCTRTEQSNAQWMDGVERRTGNPDPFSDQVNTKNDRWCAEFNTSSIFNGQPSVFYYKLYSGVGGDTVKSALSVCV